MQFEYLQPIESEVAEFLSLLSSQHLGAKVKFHRQDSFPDLEAIQVALIGVAENRGAGVEEPTDLVVFRKEFYQLYAGNWDCKIADLGNILEGNSVNDTYFALNQLTLDLLKKDIILIVIGGTQDLTYPIYRAYDNLDKMVNLVSVDSKFDFGTPNIPMSMNSYLSKIIMESPNNLNNYSNLGYQTYFTSQEEIDLMEKMFFDYHRLGEVTADITIAEPIMRDADMVSLDLTSVQSAYTGNFSSFVPNGFSGKEICALSRYAGISEKVSVFGVFNSSGLRSEEVLRAQMVWYFIEGVVYRYKEFPLKDDNNYTKYIVSFEDDEELVFYKSEVSGRWWLNFKNKLTNFALLSCSEKDYREALKGVYPEKWLKEQKKSYVIQ